MKEKQFRISVERSKDVLSKAVLLKNRMPFRDGGRRIGIYSLDRKGYIKEYRDAFEDFNFDFLLLDNSILTFSRRTEGESVIYSYAYLPEPHTFPTYSKWLEDFIPEISADDIGDNLYTEYEELRTQAPPRDWIPYIRYDFNETLYVQGRHSASHIHVGLSSQIRIAVSKIMSPTSFVAFIIKQQYPENWTIQIQVQRSLRGHRNTMLNLAEGLWADDDRVEHYLV